MIGWLLDTNVIAELIRPGGESRVKAWAAQADEAALHISILTLGEYEKGIANLPDDDPRRRNFANTRDRLAARFGEPVLPVADAVVRRWGVLSGTIRRDTGHPPPFIDTLLAATALEYDLYFVTRNVRDVRLTGASIFNPWEDDPALAAILPRRRGRR